LSTLILIIYGILAVGMALALVRIVRGPSLPDRVIALDLVASLSIGFIAVNIIDRDESAFLPGAAVLALVVFLGTLSFARYLEKRGKDD
jgi:multicomponent Na+:H+ antiporter subunit F